MSTIPGLDLGPFRDWLADHVSDVPTAELRARVIAGGKSNLTYTVEAGDSTLVVRRPPLGHVLATAHDMSREYRVMSALRDTNVPVPRTLAFCDDLTVIGAPFYVMAWVDGTPYRTAEQLVEVGPDRTRTIAENFVDALVALHRLDPREVGLVDFGRPDGFLTRQTARWRMQLEGSTTRALPAAEELHRCLVDRLPPQGSARIVHGDYRLDNVLVDAEDRAAAVIDWEMATLGDPWTDVALMVVYRRVGELVGGDAVADASSAAGFLDEGEILDRYERGTGTTAHHFGFYLGLAAYKLAAILEGIYVRHQRGQTVGAGFDRVGDVTEPLLDAGITAMKEYT